MIFGIVKERFEDEMRVGLTPTGVYSLTSKGYQVYVESGAGAGANYSNEDYKKVGATVGYRADEIFGRADMLLKIKPPTLQEYDLVRDGQVIAAWFHLAVSPLDLTKILLHKKVSAISYERIRTDDGSMPILRHTSEICGKMLPQIAARYLESTKGGKGILLSGNPGIPAATVVILGAGVVGFNAAWAFFSLGCKVTVLDRDIDRLERLEKFFYGKINTMIATQYNLEKVMKFADVFVGAVLHPGHVTPHLISRDMVKMMSPKSLIIDVSIDQGGCFETSRPTTLHDPVYVEEGVVHYCVPTMTSAVARTASAALTNAFLPYLEEIAARGLEKACEEMPALGRGLTIRGGHILDEAVLEVYESRLRSQKA